MSALFKNSVNVAPLRPRPAIPVAGATSRMGVFPTRDGICVVSCVSGYLQEMTLGSFSS